MKTINASMRKLAIVREMPDNDFQLEHQTEPVAAASILDNFKASVGFLDRNTNLFGSAPDITVPPLTYAPPCEFATATSPQLNLLFIPSQSGMQSAVASRVQSLPRVYQTNYAQPLLNNFNQFLSEIQGDLTFAETICAAVYQHSNDYVPTRGYLNRFQVVCATLYDDFLNSELRKKLNLPLIEKVPPLAMFQKAGDAGPFTIPSDDVQQLFGGSIGVVSLPGTYRNHPLLWSSLAHEVGGHDVLHADPGTVSPSLL
jgi:hypothetical protein